MNLPMRLSSDTLAIMLIGDGVLSMLRPREHMSLWRTGPEPLQNVAAFMEDRPGLTAAIGALEIGVGVWLATRAERRLD